jgi:hypothetical protein
MKTKRLLIILGIIISMILLFILLTNSKNRSYKTVTLSENNFVLFPSPKYGIYDTILRIALDVENLKNITLVILELDEKSKTEFDGELRAKIIQYDEIYYLYVNDLTNKELITVLSHEVIHIRQYESKKIIYDRKTKKVFWENEVVDLDLVPYEKRPWEIEAFAQEGDLSIKVEKIIY